MDKSLSQWAQEHNLKYHAAYRRFTHNQIDGAYRSKEGNILVKPEQPSPSALIQAQGAPQDVNWGEPSSVAIASSTRRRNAASTIIPTDRFAHIQQGISPYGAGKNADANISIREAVQLTQMAYYNFNNFRSIIDLLVELSTGDIYFEGGTEKSRLFFDAYFNKINLNEIQEKWFLEYYRSGNVFSYPLKAKIKKTDLQKITQVFGAAGDQIAESLPSGNIKVPFEFIILNPADIIYERSLAFSKSRYFKLLNHFEAEQLRNPRTEEAQMIFDSLPPQVKEDIKSNKSSSINFPLDSKDFLISFYKKQDYEAFAIPLGYGVLRDINFKAELRSVDQAISRTVNQVVLLITLGFEDKNGNYNFSAKNAAAIQEIFNNESVGRVLIADFTTKAEFLIPDIANILDPKKYEQVDKDIREGLNNILLDSGDKFANKSLSVKLFTKKLIKSRTKFLGEFLNVIIKKISKELGFKKYPKAVFTELDFKDEETVFRIYQRAYETGLFTGEETIEAMRQGKLPTVKSSLESQKKFKELKDEGYYQPLTGGSFMQQKLAEEGLEVQRENMEMQKQIRVSAPKTSKTTPKTNAPVGRPPNIHTPKKSHTPGPVGGDSLSSFNYSLSKLKENMSLAQQLEKDAEKIIKTKLKIAKTKNLNERQQEVIQKVVAIIMVNEPKTNWNKQNIIKKYLECPIDDPKNKERIDQYIDICAKHQVSEYVGGLLLNSLKSK